MTKLFLDIESIPADETQAELVKYLHAKKVAEGRTVKTAEEALADSGLSGAFGRIFCICYAINDEPVKVMQDTEPRMLIDFWHLAKSVDQFIGFNILDFDLRFIWQRSVVHQIKPTRELSFKRYSSDPIYDIMYEWSRWSGGVGSRIGLDGLARALNLPSPKDGDITGRTVYKAYKEGRLQEICDYCCRDVETTRAIYKKLQFEK